LGYWVISGMIRSFRFRTLESAALVVVAMLAMLRGAPIGDVIWTGITPISDWIASYPGAAVYRTLDITMGIGAIALAIRILIGIERSYLGGD